MFFEFFFGPRKTSAIERNHQKCSHRIASKSAWKQAGAYGDKFCVLLRACKSAVTNVGHAIALWCSFPTFACG